MTDYEYMNLAYDQALIANTQQEVPIGAVLVDGQGVVIAVGFNMVENECSQIYHAEIVVLQKAGKQLRNWRLMGSTLYVTVQPCMMCMGALYMSRVTRVVFGIPSLKYGFGTEYAVSGIYKNLNILSECLDYEPAKRLMKQFFEKKRDECVAKNGIGKD